VTTLIIDESGDDLGGSHRYVIGAGVLVANDDDLVDIRKQVIELLGSPRRRRPFHWVTEGPVMRAAAIELIGQLPIEAHAIVGAADSQHHLEHTRERCLRELFRAVEGQEIDRLMIESRERSVAVVGQNRRDFETLIEARHAQELRPTVRYQWVLKEEPLVWLADAVAGAVLAAERGDMTWLSKLGETTRTSLIRLPPERA
jgi:hypothetical protein